jgi:hypothetical protein
MKLEHLRPMRRPRHVASCHGAEKGRSVGSFFARKDRIEDERRLGAFEVLRPEGARILPGSRARHFNFSRRRRLFVRA